MPTMNSTKSWFAAQAISSIRRGIGSRLAYAILQRMQLRVTNELPARGASTQSVYDIAPPPGLLRTGTSG